MPFGIVNNLGAIKEVCVDSVCGASLGVTKGLFRVTLFTEIEMKQ